MTILVGSSFLQVFILNGFLFEQERPSARASGAHKATPRSRCSLGTSILIGWPLLPQDGRTTVARPSFLQVFILRDFKLNKSQLLISGELWIDFL